MPTQADFVQAVTILHGEKDRAYGNAWKKRGELLSILANIARKVDRIERLVEHETSTRDESPVDTAVDLLVYSLKYQTYLADLDDGVATELFATRLDRPYSDTADAFIDLLGTTDLAALDRSTVLAVPAAAASVLTAFARLEDCIGETVRFTADSLPQTRLAMAADLTAAAVVLLAALRGLDPVTFDAFIAAWTGRATTSSNGANLTTLVMRFSPEVRHDLDELAAVQDKSITDLLKQSVALYRFVWEHRDDLITKHRGKLRRLLKGA